MDTDDMTLDELYNLRAKVTIRIKVLEQFERDRIRMEKIAALKALKPRATVYTRLTGELFGKPLLKVKDGRDFMQVAGNGKVWRIAYSYLQPQPLNDVELRLGKIIG